MSQLNMNTDSHFHKRHRRLFPMLGLVALIFFLQGCGPTTVELSNHDRLDAAKMSLGDAKETIQSWARINSDVWYFENSQQVSGAKEVLEFKADAVIDKIYVGNRLASSKTYCKYAEMSPYIYPDWMAVDFGCQARDQIRVKDINQAKSLAAALWRWKLSTPQEREDYFTGKQFTPIASQYRASNSKPALSEEIRRFQVMAVSAVQEKRFGDAANDYISGLKIAPWWPQGHFNVAILLGQMHFYDEAIDHMKKYLLLVPDAPNARAAQDQIYRWEGEQNAASTVQ